MRPNKNYASLQDIRDEKKYAKRQIDNSVNKLKNDVTDYFVYHPEHFFLFFSNKYMRFVGYAISGYRSIAAFREAFGFFSKKRK